MQGLATVREMWDRPEWGRATKVVMLTLLGAVLVGPGVFGSARAADQTGIYARVMDERRRPS